MKTIAMGLILAALSFSTLAESPWSGEGDLGFNKTSGNTETESLLANLKITHAREKWVHTAELGAVNSSDTDERTAESYQARWKTDYNISETYYAFGAARYEDNRFSGFEYQASASLGFGAHLIKTENTLFDVELGAGFRESEEQGTGETLNEAILLGSAVYQYQITETTRFESDLNAEAGDDNTYIESNISVKVAINSALALRVGYSVKHNTDVPDGTDNTDTLTSVSLNYSF